MTPVAPQFQGESDEDYQKRMKAFQDSGGYQPMLDQQVVAADPFGAGEGTAGSIGGGYGKKRPGIESRGQMNLTGSRRSSILTGG
tara:strand:- start:1171 stop:1425 length:255 start_codon:yes stop_codon:yes gene_type:complete